MTKPKTPSVSDEFLQLHHQRLDRLEQLDGPLIALPTTYPDGLHVPLHSHSRGQLMHIVNGVVMVTTEFGRWLVPPDHAMWIPARIEHAVDILGCVDMHSIYVDANIANQTSADLKVVEIPGFVRGLIVEVSHEAKRDLTTDRFRLLSDLLLHEIPKLRELPLALPLPSEPRLAALCRAFVQHPSPRTSIEDWAGQLGMSRRTFTRSFHRQTGLSLTTWRQQACLFAALPKLAEGQTVTRVALDLGYDSVPAFTTMFRRMTGISPRRYLQKAKVA